GGDEDGLAARVLDRGQPLLGLGGVATDDCDLGARLREALRHRAAELARAAGDDRDFALQRELIFEERHDAHPPLGVAIIAESGIENPATQGLRGLRCSASVRVKVSRSAALLVSPLPRSSRTWPIARATAGDGAVRAAC